VAILLNVELALAEGVPELDGAVAGSGDDLPVVGREGNGEDIGGVADEATGGEAGVEVPETKGLVPGGGEGELSVGGDNDVRDEVVVAVENSLGEAIGRLYEGKGGEVSAAFLLAMSWALPWALLHNAPRSTASS
jgi:hypothetical protein